MRLRRSGMALLVCATTLARLGAVQSPATACGHCIEDKVAATYDYAVLTRAASQGHVVVFVDVRGPAAGASLALKTFIARALSTTPGIDAGTVRVSLDPAAASFACDPARHAPSVLLASVNPRLASKGLRLVTIEIDHGPSRE